MILTGEDAKKFLENDKKENDKLEKLLKNHLPIKDSTAIKSISTKKKEIVKIAFDVDGTLIKYQNFNPKSGDKDIPNYEIINLFLLLKNLKNVELFIWSGSGSDYAKTIARNLGLDKYAKIIEKGSIIPDICFDDMEVELAISNIQV